MPAVEISPVKVKPSAPAELLDTPCPGRSLGSPDLLVGSRRNPWQTQNQSREAKARTQSLKWALPGNRKM